MITGTQTGTTPTVYDTGTVTAAISNLPAASYTYGSSDTPATIASGLAAAINSKDSAAAAAVATTVNGVATVQVSSKATGYGINWPDRAFDELQHQLIRSGVVQRHGDQRGGRV